MEDSVVVAEIGRMGPTLGRRLLEMIALPRSTSVLEETRVSTEFGKGNDGAKHSTRSKCSVDSVKIFKQDEVFMVVTLLTIVNSERCEALFFMVDVVIASVWDYVIETMATLELRILGTYGIFKFATYNLP